MPRTKKHRISNKRCFTKLQTATLKQYNNCLCTRCGDAPVTSDQINTYYKGVKVRIMLCATCVPVIVQRAIDVAIEGHDRENLIDSLTKYGQI